MSLAHRALGAAIGVAGDRVLGEPPRALHPVARFGQAMGALERQGYADRRGRGLAYLTIGAGGAAAVGFGLTRGTRSALVATALATEVATSGRMLGDAADGIATVLAAGDLDSARRRLPELVGRDPSGLGASELARAVIESVAENTVDAVVAPLWWGAAGGATGVLAHRAINTLDAMVGHHSPRYERFGWAAARADDIAAWLPARLAAGLVMVARPRRANAVRLAVRDDAPAHPSPNGGVIEAAYAAALGLRLGGANRYGDRVEHRGALHPGGRAPEAGDVLAATRLLRDVTGLGAVLAIAAGVGQRAWRRRR